ncbi:MAG: GntP family gluconate:H+ symporter [Verrucomicrobiales bacterium]|jgi:GntP family gluconate:H+ symporter
MTILLAAFQLPPIAILGLGIVLVILLITKLGMHPFFALLVTGMVVGMLSASLPGEGSHWIKAIETPLAEMGKLAGKIAFVIALAAVIGICLTESGAADKIVLRFVAVLGEKRAGVALLLSGFVLSVPVFFDTVFFLLIPLARALARQVGKNYVLFVMAMAGGAVITHSLVPPTPGPLLMTEAYRILLGSGILGGVLMGLPPAFFALWLAKKIDARMPLSPVGSESDATSFSEEGLPSFGLSILPVLLPVLLVTSVSIVDTLGQDKSKAWYQALSFFGNKNMALLIGTLLAVSLVVRKLGRDREALQGFVNDALQTAGVIILITSAGGAFGAMIGHSGIKESIQGLSADGRGLILLAWGVAAVMKIAQGSGTVAMITTSSIMASIISKSDLGFHPIYIYMATGFGSMFISWMNDSGFWVVGRMSGFTEKQTLKTWTVLLAAIGVFGLLQTLLVSYLLPFAG